MNKLRKLSINIILPCILLSVLIVLQGGMFLYQYQQDKNRLYITSEHQIKEMAEALQISLSTLLMPLEKSKAQEALSSISLQKNIKTVAVIDDKHEIVLSNHYHDESMLAKLHIESYEGALLERANVQNEMIVKFDEDSQEFFVYAPLQVISKENSLNSKLNAAIFIRYSLANAYREIRHENALLLINLSFMIVICIGILVYFIHRLVSLPIKQLIQAASVNDLSAHPVVSHSAIGEIGELQRAFTKFNDDISVNIDQISASEQRWLYAVNAARDGVWDWDIEHDIFFYSTRWKEILGFPLGYLKQDIIEWEDRIHPDDLYTAVEDSAAHFAGKTPFFENTHRVKCYDGDYRWVLSRGQAVAWDEHGFPLRAIGTITDVSTYKNFSEAIQYYNQFDEVTELPNRLKLTAHISQEVARLNNNGLQGVLIFIDCHLDNNDAIFKRSSKQKQILYSFARRLENNKSPSDYIGYLQDSGFVILLPDLHKHSKQAGELALNFVKQLDIVLKSPFIIDGETCLVDCHYGITLFPSYNLTADDLLIQATQATKNMSESPFDSISFFDKSLQVSLNQQHILQSKIRYGLDNGAFNLFFKPRIDCTGKLIAAEVSTRWLTDQGEWINPMEGISIDENADLLIYLYDWGILQAFLDCKTLVEKGHTESFNTLSIHLHQKQLLDDNFLNVIKKHLSTTGINAKLIEFQITEVILSTGTNVLIERLKELHALGFRLAVDNFGTANCSFSHLYLLPFSALTIDNSHLENILDEQNEQVIVNAIINLSKSFNLTVIAKEVADKQQLDYLIAKGCHQFQGPFIGEPLSINHLISLIQRDGQN
jgi:EAL domain-containing protein (putative c-di-GMP-specific phosphodiesterase class I)/GGDEF domain-containing protein/PAS domain-containing protein